MEEYKGYAIEFNIYGQNEYTVQLDDGSDLWCVTKEEAKKMIDEIVEGR